MRPLVLQFSIDNSVMLCYLANMSDIFLRKMPEDLIRRVKSQAALQGITMRDFVVDALEKALQGKEGKPKRGTASRKD